MFIQTDVSEKLFLEHPRHLELTEVRVSVAGKPRKRGGDLHTVVSTRTYAVESTSFKVQERLGVGDAIIDAVHVDVEEADDSHSYVYVTGRFWPSYWHRSWVEGIFCHSLDLTPSILQRICTR